MLAEYLGLTPRWLESSSTGGSSFEFHTMHAFRAIEAGDVDTVAIVYGNNQLSASGRTLGTGGGGGGRARHGDAAADGLRVPVGAHARRRVRDGRATAHAPVRHDARAARVDLGADARARGAQPERDVPRSDHRRRRAVVAARRRSAAQARLLRDLRRRLLHHPDHRGAGPRPRAPPGVRARRGRRHDAPLDPGDGRHDAHRRRGERPEGVRRSRASRRPTSTCSRCTTRSPTRCSSCSKISASRRRARAARS